jgi:hypothetical protein
LAARIGDRLENALGPGRVVWSSECGESAPGKVAADCDVFVVVLGQRPRFDNSEDVVQQAIELALTRGRTLIPARIEGAEFPTPATLPESLHALAFQNGLEIRSGPHFDRDFAKLLAAIRAPASGHDLPAPRTIAVQVLAESWRRMGFSTLLLVLGAGIYWSTANVAAGDDWTPLIALGLVFGLPGLAGLAAGIHHGWLSGLTGLIVGGVFPVIQVGSFYLIGEQAFTWMRIWFGLRETGTLDFGFIVVPSAVLLGTLLGSAYAAHQAIAADAAWAGPSPGVGWSASCGVLAGLGLSLLLWWVVVQVSDEPGWLYRVSGSLVVLLLLGSEFGVLSAILARVFGRNP